MVTSQHSVPWIIMLVICSCTEGCTTLNVCPGTPCFCTNATADCSGKNLTDIKPLDKLPCSITSIDLSGNKFRYIHDNFFEPIVSLKIETLILSRSTVVHISDKAFQHIPKLEKLDLSRNDLNYTSIQKVLDGLKSCVQISDLDISDVKRFNLTTELPIDAFKSLHSNNGSLKTLRLRKWGLVNVSGTSFKNLTELRTLDLSNNDILALKMEGLSNIKCLNLTQNELSSVPVLCDAERNSYVPCMERLYLAINHISDSLEFYRQGHCLTELKCLNLSFNAISIFKSNSFSTIRSLKELYVENMLTYDLSIEEDAFQSESLEALFLGSYKRVTKEMLHYRTIFSKCPNLVELDMSKFDFSNFEDQDFRDMLSPLLNLANLTLRQALLNFVPYISHLKNLHVLNLDNNFIRHIHKDTFSNNSHLHTILLRKNQLTSIREDSFTEEMWKHPNLSIDVSFNPFACDCDLEWFIQWSRMNRGHVKHYDSNQCDSPKEWKGNHIHEHQNILRIKCNPLDRGFLIGITVGSFVFIFLFTFILIRKLKWDIMYHLHNCMGGRRRRYRRFINKDVKKYDSFVAYNTHDRKWIMSELVETLENKENYKLCLHERNFLPIGSHVDNILENVEASRTFILVLSNNFLEDQWCQYETVVANHKLADGNKDTILLILLDDIDSKHFTVALKTLLKEAESVEWTTNINGKKLFWKKLRRFMCDH
ncbi:toll-like receptor 13 isoform X2 [Ostrea edulis]|nr:toll-like receptor 13 isoform X2 [Ostrea edulis]XP_048749192.1 toll-like receptor 13 isoform X2 [Ostrea edulis]